MSTFGVREGDCSPCVYMDFLWVRWFPPPVRRYAD